MTDKQLLELAAKAAGIKIDKSETNGGGRGNTGFDILGNAVIDWHNGTKWNPLTDDGDALRLAVKLGIMVDPYHGIVCVRDMDFDFNPHIIEATRRAIVRAAAEIGKAIA